MTHIALLGDSIFDNWKYTAGGPAVIDHLQRVLGDGGSADLLAVDGSVTADVPGQLAGLASGVSHLVVSAGGNDAIGASGVTTQPATAVGEALVQLSITQSAFEASYKSMLKALVAVGKPVIVCTIYFPAFPDPVYQTVAVAGLSFFNDAIIRAAVGVGLPLIDLRKVCDSPADYANEIEPSAQGGEKIARAIAAAVDAHDFTSGRTVVYS